MKKSAYSPQEVIEFINSDDQEKQGVGARNLWAFWATWENTSLFSEISARLLELFRAEIQKLREENKGGFHQPRHIWHFMLALGSLQYKDGLPLIKEVLADLSIVENIRGFAADALTRYPPGSLDEEYLEVVWKLGTTDESLPVRVNCFRVVAAMHSNSKNGDIAKRFWKVLEEQDNPAIKTTIMGNIAEIGSKEIVPDLVHTLITRRTGTLKKDAGLALDRIAELNGLSGRDELIKSIDSTEMLD